MTTEIMYGVAADSYYVGGVDQTWTATVMSGYNVIATYDAVSEKQAHFLIARDFPELMSNRGSRRG